MLFIKNFYAFGIWSKLQKTRSIGRKIKLVIAFSLVKVKFGLLIHTYKSTCTYTHTWKIHTCICLKYIYAFAKNNNLYIHAFVRIYKQSFLHAFHAHIGMCIKLFLHTFMYCTLIKHEITHAYKLFWADIQLHHKIVRFYKQANL